MRKITGFAKCSVLAAGVLAMTVATPAAAAEAFGQQGDIAFSAERLMGIYFLNDEPFSGTLVGLGASPSAHPYTTARFGFDGFVVNKLSLGGSFVFTSDSPKRGGNSTEVLLAPRVGYALQISDAFGFWPRAGFTYRNNDGNDELALTLEAMFYGSPVQHFAFTFGPVFDLGLVGSGNEAVNFGLLTAGIMGWI
jgi:hypothetical protein